MKYLYILLCLLAASCSNSSNAVAPLPDTDSVTKIATPEASSSATTQPDQTAAPSDSSVTDTTQATTEALPETEPLQPHALQYNSFTIEGITFNVLSFDTNEYHLKVADQTPGAKWDSAYTATSANKGLAAINGGFFTPLGTPLGLVHSAGKKSGEWNTDSSLTSGVYQFVNGSASLQRNHQADRNALELLQTGPFLLENSSPVKGLAKDTAAQRSLLLWDGANHFALAYTSSCSLDQLAQALTNLPTPLPRHTALNLDGGRSCDLYVSPAAHSASVQKGHWLRNQVRNYLVLVPN